MDHLKIILPVADVGKPFIQAVVILNAALIQICAEIVTIVLVARTINIETFCDSFRNKGIKGEKWI